MDIKWSYYLIILIYMLVIILRLVNSLSAQKYKKQHQDYKAVFSIKKDFFTTVSIACLVTTVAINSAALIGGRPINKSSIIITILVIGFTLINSCYKIYFSEESTSVCWLGYEINAGEIEELKIKEGQMKTVISMTLSKEIDSYNFAKLVVFGKDKKELQDLLASLKIEKIAE